MDPNANIARQRELARLIIEVTDSYDGDRGGEGYEEEVLEPIGRDLAPELAELVQALDGWRLKGGFDPYLPSAPDSPGCIRRTYMYVDGETASAGSDEVTYEEFARSCIQDDDVAREIAERMLSDNDSSENFDPDEGVFEHYVITNPSALRAQMEEE